MVYVVYGLVQMVYGLVVGWLTSTLRMRIAVYTRIQDFRV